MTANDSVSLEPPPQGLLRDPELNTVGSGQQHSTRAPRPLSVMGGAAGGGGRGTAAAVENTGPMRLLGSAWDVLNLLR